MVDRYAACRQADFEVTDDGHFRKILDFRNDVSPISVGLLLDSSGSMHIGGKLERASEVGHFLLSSMSEGTDEAALFVFDKVVRTAQPFTNDFDKVRSSFASVHPWGSTSLYDAIAETAQQLSKRPGRRAIIVLTDGVDTSSQLTPQEVSGIASAIDMPVYVVAVDTTSTERRIDESRPMERWDALWRLKHGGRQCRGAPNRQRTSASVFDRLRAEFVGGVASDRRAIPPAGDAPGPKRILGWSLDV